MYTIYEGGIKNRIHLTLTMNVRPQAAQGETTKTFTNNYRYLSSLENPLYILISTAGLNSLQNPDDKRIRYKWLKNK